LCGSDQWYFLIRMLLCIKVALGSVSN
jgi:hypothetical protein